MEENKIPSYSEAVAQIEKILRDMEANEPDVDLLIAKVQHAAELIKICKDKLQKTDVELQKILNEI